ncbi:response regulator [Thalassoporum mexicanum]
MPNPLEEVSQYPEEMTMTSTPLGSGSNPTGGVRDGQVVRDASLLILLAALRVMVRSSGILHVETAYHRWKLLLQRGGLVLMEEEGHVIATLTSKLGNRGIRFARIPNWEQKEPNRPYCYPFVSQVFKRYPEQTKSALKEILLENLLALHLEDKFSFVWRPVSDIPDNLPVWQLSLLEGNASKEARQWQQFQYVQHPYQRVQLLDAANMLARVGNDNFPLFARVTTGQHRLSAIADSFKQPIYRTALLLDKLAQKKIVAILPLEQRHSQEALGAGDQPIQPPMNITGPKIFVVDDSPVLLRQFHDLLVEWGYQVSLSDDATTATQLIANYMPAVIFLDINMPGLSGFELIKQIRRQPNLAEIPLVLVTAENSMSNSFRARWANCRFIAKPKTIDDTVTFREQLRTVLRELAPLPTDQLV